MGLIKIASKKDFSEFQQKSRESTARPNDYSRSNSRIGSARDKLSKEIMRIHNDTRLSPRSKKKILSRISSNYESVIKQHQGQNDRSTMNLQGRLQTLTKQELLKMKSYPIGNCPYCLTPRLNIIDLDCTHQFCSKCCLNLIKITKIKKGLNYFCKTQEEIIKCPKCHQINILHKDKYQEI